MKSSFYKVLLFYKYAFLENVTSEIIAQKNMCLELGITGRILLAHEGVNGTICGTEEACQKYMEYMKSHTVFFDIDFKESSSSFLCFAKLYVKHKKELVNFGVASQEVSYLDAAPAITPEELHELLKNNKDIVLLDTRNDYESKIGTFENAIIPNTKYFRDLPDYLKKNKELFQDKDVVMFCTGEIRCEISSAYFKSLGYAKSIRKLKGGIHRYVEAFENGFFKGRNYVFDDRISMKINENILTYCIECLHECDLYNNCKNALCNKQYICCDQCLKTTYGCCSDVCKQLIVDLKVPQRPPLVSRKIFSGVIS